MANFIKTISSRISETFTKVKFYRYGKSDIQETKQATPFGIDSNPIADMTGLYIKTDVQGETILVGYINKNAIADVGELRLFSTNTNGGEKAYCHFKNDGNIHFNGDEDNMVRFSELKTAYEELQTKFNDHVANWNLWCNTYVPGSPVFTGLPATAVSLVSTVSSGDIDPAKIVKIKTSMSD